MNKLAELLESGVIAINVGVREFAESLQEQGCQIIQVDWVPPAGGDRELIDILDQLL
jgi:hypothetical protein